MTKIISFSKAKKIKAREEKQKTAQSNRVKFGRTKAEKNLEAAKRTKLDKHLSDHQKDD